MRRIAVASCTIAFVVGAVAACEKITHQGDFENAQVIDNGDAGGVGPEAAPEDEICRRCGDAGADLRHPPCHTTSTVPNDGQFYVYAWRSLRLGLPQDPTKTLDPASYDQHVGYDLDCSNREPTGLPAKCAAIIPEAGADAETAWKPFPQGIDNALAQRFLGPLYLGALKVDMTTLPLDVSFSTQLEQGKGSVLTVVYNWNGTDDDEEVSVRIVSGFGLVDGTPPKWDGTDRWIAATGLSDPDVGDQVPLVNSKTDHAYVAGGVLVVDFSKIKPLLNHIVNGGVDLFVPLYDMHMVANITKDKLTYEQFFGLWPLSDFAASNDKIAAFLGACDAAKTFALKRALPGLSNSAADLVLPDDTLAPTDPCDALSVTWAADAYRGSIGAYKAFTSTPTPCP